MASMTPARRVLGDMSVNTPIGSTPKKGFKAGVERGLEKESRPKSSGKLFGEVVEKNGDGHVLGSTAKRRRIDSEGGRGRESLSPIRVVNLASSSSSASPSSSFGNSTTELNDSQNTILTIPDDGLIYNHLSSNPPSFQAAPLTAAQMRAKATSIRLRLTLASYKLRTNQIDVPISRLEIRPSQTPNLPQLKRTASGVSTTSQLASTSFPSQRGRRALPGALLASLSAQTVYPLDEERDISSSPPPSRSGGHERNALVSPVKGRDVDVEEFTTPILPRQRAGLLNPPLLGGREDDADGDLTSSVVKGRAADGLLRLMGMRD